MPRRILLLITDLKIGGTPTVVRELALRLHADPDFYVHVACLDQWGPVADQLKSAGVPVTAFSAKASFDLRVIHRLVKLVRSEKIDTVLSFLVHANAVAAAASKFLPGVRFLQSIQTTQPNPRWHWKVQHFAAHAAEKIIVPSPSVTEAAHRWAGIDESKIVVIPNAIDLSAPNITRTPHDGKRIGFIGRLDPIKRIGDLIDAMAFLPNDVSLEIFGDGTERQNLESQIRTLNQVHRIKLHGPIPTPWQALAEIDILVLPSEAEGFGLVLIEAMAAGVPIIATNVPGIRDVITIGETGLLVPVKNPRNLADAIKKILNDSRLQDHLVSRASERVRQRYDWKVVYRAYRELLI